MDVTRCRLGSLKRSGIEGLGWKLELDVEYVGWKSNRNLYVQLSSGGIIPQSQQWKTVTVVAVGTEYKWLNPAWLPHWDIAVRSGYTRIEDPVPDRTFNPATISLPSNTLSIGAGFLCKDQGRFLGMVPCGGASALWPKAIGLDVAFQEWFYEPRTVAGNLNPTVDGTYHAYCAFGDRQHEVQVLKKYTDLRSWDSILGHLL